MRVLLTNDDGIDSPGLAALAEALGVGHEVWIIAPDGERSGTSHYITLKGPVRVVAHDVRRLASGGSPADCVMLGLLGGMPQPPDVVLSGINIGANLGTDLVYSGTAAAARQGAIMGLPGLAVSLNAWQGRLFFEPLARFVADNLVVLRGLVREDTFLNINAPNSEVYRGVRMTRPCRRVYKDNLVSIDAPQGDRYYFIKGETIEIRDTAGSDWEAVADGYISISSIGVQPAVHDGLGEAEFILP